MSDPTPVIPKTYQQLALEALAGMGDAVNTALAAAGLAPLVDWFTGNAEDSRDCATPFAWFERLPNKAESELDKTGHVAFELRFAVVVVLGAFTVADLEAQIAAYGPVIEATIETQGCAPYRVRVLGSSPYMKGHEGNAHLAMLEILVTISGDRTRRSVN